MATIKELAEPLATRVLQNRLNYTLNGLLGQPTAIPIAIAQPTAIPIAIAQPTAIALKPPRTQIPTPITP